jgi:hypothetical protein
VARPVTHENTGFQFKSESGSESVCALSTTADTDSEGN